MPEGDVVWRSAQRLHAALAGRRVVRSDLRWPSLATVDLTGRVVAEVVSRGKHLLVRLGPGGGSEQPLTLHSHLRMEGSWHVHATGQPWRTARAAHGVRAVLANAEWTAVGHRLGMLDLVPTSEEARLVGHLGPDVLGPAWGPDAVAAVVGALRARPAREVGEALLDQSVLAGVGTYFMAEALFLRGLSPWTPVEALDDDALRALVELERRLLLAGTKDVAHGSLGYVHARSGLPCRRCGTAVRVAPIGRAPQERSAFYCPRCQPGPTPTDDGSPQAPLGAVRRR
ncbi:Fpg/Nei family DNA glycosylase [Streptomyces sp. NP160]|uniref:DNA-formamidopyrimidine glycosylase family protein n=1 Tax=Streptomyces sp. NP160 TaxID=2586637 RepID=UPI001117BAA9|nr:DNA-formamidopyrimidine glycosylase family protein [Streptomyces sp. NP160]TNM68300.1 Fpg/Nei family DNA glycosylase [Streptomyces sp. NP160]